MNRFSCKPSRINTLFCAALIVLMSACTTIPQQTSPPPTEIAVELGEITVWVNVMPGATPRGHALYMVKLLNTSDSAFSITSIEGYIAEPDGPVIRRFSVNADAEGRPVTAIELIPGITKEFRIKDSAGYEPFSTQQYPAVTAGITFTTSNGKQISAEQSPVQAMLTQ